MRIRDFSIDRFGVLHNQSVSGLPPGISVFLGDNEAGKSTCLNFFRAMLFGYARNRRSIDYAADSKTLSGGALLLESKDLGLVRLTRRPGPHGGPATLTAPDGSARPGSDLALLLRGCTADLYDKVFAFSLDELALFGALREDAVRGALHGAAFGTGLRSPGQVLKELDESMKRVFAPKAVVRSKIHQLLDELESLQANLEQKGNEVARYAALRTELAAVDRDLEAGRAFRRSLEAEQRRRDRRLALRRRGQALREAEGQLAAHPETPGLFAPDGRERLDRLEARLEDRHMAAATAEKALVRLEDELAKQAERADAALLGAAPALAALRERKESIRAAALLLPDLAREQAACDADLATQCAALGEGWDAARAAGFELSLALREEGDRLGRDLGLAERDRDGAEEARRRVENERASAEAALAALADGQDGAQALDADEIAPDAAENLQRLLLRATDAYENTGGLALALRNAGQALDQALAAVHSDWTRQDLERLNLTLAERNGLAALANAALAAAEDAAEARRAVAAAEDACEDARRRLAALSVESITSGCEGAGDDVGNLAARAAMLRRAQYAARALDAARRRHEAVNEQLNEVVTLSRSVDAAKVSEENPAASGRPGRGLFSPRALTALSALLALFACGTAVHAGLLSASSLLLYAGAGQAVLGLVLLGLAFFRPERPSAVNPDTAWQDMEQRLIRSRQAARALVEEAKAALRAALADGAELFPDNDVNPSLLPELLPELLAEAQTHLTRQRELLLLRERDVSYLEQERTALALAEQRGDSAKMRLAAAVKAEEASLAAWRSALAKAGLPDDAVPGDLGLLLGKIDNATGRRAVWKGRATEERDAEERINACRAFALGISPLADRLASLPEAGSNLAPEPGAWLEAVRQYLVEWRETGHARIRLRELRFERETRLAEAMRLLSRAEETLAASRETLAARQRAWRAWLAARRLSPALSPETARLALDAAARARNAREQSRRITARKADLLRDLAGFARDLADRATALVGYAEKGQAGLDAASALAANPEDGSAARLEAALILLDDLAAKAVAATEAELLRGSREKELPPVRDVLAQAKTAVAATEAEIAELLRLGGCDSAEAFRRAHSLWARREEILAAKSSLEASLAQEAADLGLGLADLLASFGAETDEAPDAQAQDNEQALVDAGQRERTLAERRGGLAAAMDGLTGEAGLTELLCRRESLKEEIRREAHEWSRLALAKELLLSAKRRFESERQTGVVRLAGELFAAFTDGAYSGITVSLDDEAVRAVSRKGEVKNPENELSRGTREQLYLALRLAYAQDHGAQAETLPLVMDDILVNFDARRAGHTARALADFSAQNQILFFTCHQGTADMLAKAAPQGARYSLRGGVFERE